MSPFHPHRKTILVCLLSIWLAPGFLFAQDYSYRYYGVPDGLAQSQVMCIFQDTRGFLWIGTKGGVSCFDGVNFRNFTENDGLPNDLVLNVCEDSAGTIWFLTRKGLSAWDGEKMRGFPSPLFIHYGGLQSFFTTGAGKVTLYSSDSVNCLCSIRFENGQYKVPEPVRPIIPADKVWPGYAVLHEPKTGNTYVASDFIGLFRLTTRGADTLVKGKFDIRALFTGGDGRSYAWIEDDLYILRGSRAEKIARLGNMTTPGNSVIGVSRSGKVYFSIQHPFLSVFDHGGETRDHFQFTSLNCFFTDRQDNLWIGTETGLYRLISDAFVNFIPGKCGIPQYVWSVTEDRNGDPWFSSYTEGIHSWDGKKFHPITSYRRIASDAFNNFYMGSKVDHCGNLWITRNVVGIVKYDGRRFSLPLPKGERQTVMIVYEDEEANCILAGVSGGYFKIPFKGDPSLIRVKPGGGKSYSVVSIAKDRNGVYWLGGFDGISLDDHGHIINLPDKQYPFDLGAIAMVKDPRGNLWIGNKKGLYLYDYHQFNPVEVPEVKTMIAALSLVGDSGLLVGTTKGVAWLDLKRYYTGKSPLFKYFDKNNGFEGIEVGQNGFFRDSKGFYWIPASDRVVRFDPRQVSRLNHDILCYLTDVSVLNDKMEWGVREVKALRAGERTRFSHNQKNLRFRFIGMDLALPERVTYSCYLEGYDRNWSPARNSREAVYTNLPPGRYTFHVIARDDEGNTSSAQLSFAFRIVPAFWQTWWFWATILLLAAAGFFLLGYFFMNQRKKTMQEHLESEKRIAELQLLSIYNQIDPHFTFNAMNSIASVVLKEEKEKAYRFFVKLSSLIRQVLTSGDRLTRTLSEELVFVHNYLEIEKLRFRDTFEFGVEIRQPVDLDREVPKMVIQTYVENAMKHGLLNKTDGAGRLCVRVWDESGALHIEVEDNGIGREQASRLRMAGTGKGLMLQQFYYDFFDRYNHLKILYEITDLHKEDGDPAGTRVTVIIPAGFRYTIKDHEQN
ncbi:MAG TPA: two-component regulator propeller domain-containing protein [Bacteroidales bacterium]|nr:two-component regulator propeller domain-containing protein [Bacteroidales bacterium]